MVKKWVQVFSVARARAEARCGSGTGELPKRLISYARLSVRGDLKDTKWKPRPDPKGAGAAAAAGAGVCVCCNNTEHHYTKSNKTRKGEWEKARIILYARRRDNDGEQHRYKKRERHAESVLVYV